MRNYSSPFSSTSSSSSAASTPGLDESTSTSRPSNTGQIYSNWVFVTSAEVLARAGEGEDDEGGGEGYHDHVEGGVGTGGEGSGGGSTTTGATPGGGWTKRQYREESEKLRGKEWVFR